MVRSDVKVRKVRYRTVGDVGDRVDPVVGRVHPRQFGERGVPVGDVEQGCVDRAPEVRRDQPAGDCDVSARGASANNQSAAVKCHLPSNNNMNI